MDVEQQIARLKAKHCAANDQELARALHLGKSTIGSWRARGSVPDRYIKALDSGGAAAFSLIPAEMTEEEWLALSLALTRVIRDEAPVIADPRALIARGVSLPIVLIANDKQALDDMGATEHDIGTYSGWENKFNVIAYDEFMGKN